MALFGILNVYKPTGCTSRECVDRVERFVRPAKAGHAGTLDPLATGVLVICVGQATRLIEYVQRMSKHYRATFLLGRRSETDDVEGDVSEVADAPVPAQAALEQLLPRFLGEIQQVPPAHSAVKIRGRRAYQLARAGKPVELTARKVSIHHLLIRRYDYPVLELDIECGSGTYVRSLGRDIAKALGTSAVMSELERTAIGRFRTAEAVQLEKLSVESLPFHLKSPISVLHEMPLVTLTGTQLVEICHGRLVQTRDINGLPQVQPGIEYAAVNSAGELAAIVYEKKPGEFWPVMNFGE